MMFHVEQNEKNFHCEAKDHLVTGERFKIYFDETKAIGKTAPIPKKEEMSKYYFSESYRPHSANKRSLIDSLYVVARNHMHRKRLMWMKNYLKRRSNVLDYGCGSGDFVKFLRNKSVNAFGYDPNVNFNKTNSPSYLTNKEDWKHKKYDIIVLWHVLEHTHDPLLLIGELKKTLNERGKIFIAVPNFKCYDSKYYGEYWAGYDLPRHLWHFSRKAIYQIANCFGFKIHKEKSLYLDSLYVSYLSEKYRKSYFPLLKGSVISTISIFRSLFTKEGSSLFFIFNKI